MISDDPPDAPLAVSFTAFGPEGSPVESADVRQALDYELKKQEAECTETCAAMIFPLGNVQLIEARLNRIVTIDELTQYYLQSVFPRLRALNARDNGRGTYFFRMINFGADPKNDQSKGINQLSQILSAWQKNNKIVHSKLQVAIREPFRDLNENPRPFFPCLQQVSFGYDKSGGVSVTGFYPTQYIFDRAYGNYLGLAHLGWFIARALGKKLVRVNCITAHPLLGSKAPPKAELLRKFPKPGKEAT